MKLGILRDLDMNTGGGNKQVLWDKNGRRMG